MKDIYYVIGLMSGTSLDGVDLAYVCLKYKEEQWQYEIMEAETVSYSASWVQKLIKAVHLSPLELNELDTEYTELLGSTIISFINKHNLHTIDAVCSHGHTVLHEPHKGITLQIGNLPLLAQLTNQKIVCDFRKQDVAIGGQGAPLVPIGDALLFSQYEFCLNLGGFSNISFDKQGKRIAFDISPVNTVLNYYASLKGSPYDAEGKIARTGMVNGLLLDQLNELAFYKKEYPKSLGIEFVNSEIFPLINKYSLSPENALATFIEHIAFQIEVVLRHATGKMLVTGGGAYNDYLIERIKYHLPAIDVVLLDKKTIEFKEALIFALLGVLKLEGKINVLSSVTGAKEDHVAGFVYL